jgi:hypothetical protein
LTRIHLDIAANPIHDAVRPLVPRTAGLPAPVIEEIAGNPIYGAGQFDISGIATSGDKTNVHVTFVLNFFDELKRKMP